MHCCNRYATARGVQYTEEVETRYQQRDQPNNVQCPRREKGVSRLHQFHQQGIVGYSWSRIASGHSWSLNTKELGYLIYGSRLDSGYFDLNDSSISSLGDVTCGNDNACFKKLIRGKRSLGHFMNQEGLRAVPSPQEPGPMVRLTGTYFSGGFTVKEYGSKDEGVIDAIQMEFPRELRKNKTAWENSRRKVARAFVNFFRLNYDSGIGVNDV